MKLEQKIFRQWKILWTFLASILSAVSVYNIFAYSWKDVSFVFGYTYSSITSITLQSNGGWLVGDLILRGLVGLIISFVVLFIIWLVRDWIINGLESWEDGE